MVCRAVDWVNNNFIRRLAITGYKCLLYMNAIAEKEQYEKLESKYRQNTKKIWQA